MAEMDEGERVGAPRLLKVKEGDGSTVVVVILVNIVNVVNVVSAATAATPAAAAAAAAAAVQLVVGAAVQYGEETLKILIEAGKNGA